MQPQHQVNPCIKEINNSNPIKEHRTSKKLPEKITDTEIDVI